MRFKVYSLIKPCRALWVKEHSPVGLDSLQKAREEQEELLLGALYTARPLFWAARPICAAA